ncbi:MAG TPA: serpin family protein [Acholeplasmataceae bacterium]|nr:serpin family protein [Acholeplasmataceae bacterium]
MAGCNHSRNEISTPKYPEATKYVDIAGSKYQGLKLDYNFFTSVNEFSYQTSSILIDGSENQIYSPISLYMALSMVAEGCSEDALSEVLTVLNVENLEMLRTENEKLFKKLYFNNDVGKLLLANSIWLNQDRQFVKDTLDILAEKYYAHSFSLDFTNSQNGKKIAKWVSEHTGGKLGNENNEFSLRPNMLLILINTIYFYDEWVFSFDENLTTSKPFYGDKVDTTLFMNGIVQTKYLKTDQYELASIPFKNKCNIVFILPNEDVEITWVLQNLQSVAGNIQNTTNKSIILEIPKFSFKSDFDLIPMLQELGINEIFSNDNSLTNIITNQGYVSSVIQKSYINVNEKGCEATAYTKVTVVETSEPDPEFTLMLNRPFVFVIVNEENLPLFIGVLKDPQTK